MRRSARRSRASAMTVRLQPQALLEPAAAFLLALLVSWAVMSL